VRGECGSEVERENDYPACSGFEGDGEMSFSEIFVLICAIPFSLVIAYLLLVVGMAVLSLGFLFFVGGVALFCEGVSRVYFWLRARLI